MKRGYASMNTTNELTIVIPAKNEAKLIPRLLTSLTKQDYAKMSSTRVLVADANSTDGTPEIVMSFREAVLFAEDYLLSQQVERKRFAIVRGGVYTTNRRFKRMGHLRVGWLFVKTAMNFWNEDYFLRDHKYWQT